jgi:pimeloyl-ACP methyl ester carboxylesterase
MTKLPLVLVPGMMCDARLFVPQIAAFSVERVVHYAPISDHDSVEALAADILKNAPPRFALAGLSMGGIVAMEVVRQAAGRVDRLALLDTNPFAETDAVKAKRVPQIDAVREGKLAEVMAREMIPHYRHGGCETPEMDARALDMALDLGAEVFLRQSRALMTRPDQIGTLRAYRGRALVLTGENDRLCPMDRHLVMADTLEKSHLEIIKGAGHLPTLEQPEATNRALAEWLEK